MINQKAINREIKKALRLGQIKTIEDAEAVARLWMSSDEPSYQANICVSPLLTKKVVEVLQQFKFTHPWFKGRVKKVVFVDSFNRIWSKTTGVIKEGVPIQLINGEYSINSLGGMMWRSKKGRTFVCCYRTSKEEMKERINPETFVS